MAAGAALGGRHRAQRPGIGCGGGARPGAHQRPQPPRPHHPGDLRRRTVAAGHRGRVPTRGATSSVLEVDTADAPPVTWSDDPPVLRRGGVRRGAGPRGASGSASGSGQRHGPHVPRPEGPPGPGAIEHTAPLARGSSGGPLVDRNGAVVGINTHRLGDGFYLAVSCGRRARGPRRRPGRGSLRATTHAGHRHRTRPRRRAACGVRSAFPSATGSWSAASRPARPRPGPASPVATCWSRPPVVT